MKDPKNNLIIIYGGIGDALLWTPALKACGNKPDLVFLYQTPELKILEQNKLVDRVFKIESKSQLLFFAVKNIGRYETVFLNHLCGGSFLLKMMSLCSEKVVTNSANYFNGNKVIKKDPIEGVHDSVQNYYLIHKKTPTLVQSDFELEIKSSQIQLPSSFITVQLSAGNNQTPYKNWPVKNWSTFFGLALKKYPDQKFLLLGHKDETSLVEQLIIKSENVISLIGKTKIDETFDVIKKSDLFIGLDGGLLHVAIAAGKPTFTIWGGSSTVLYGYNKLLGAQHFEIKQDLKCMPCNAWQDPNTTKQMIRYCGPDFACLRTLTAEKVFAGFEDFQLKSNVLK